MSMYPERKNSTSNINNRHIKHRFPVIITDLDGTLLDTTTYSFEATLPALEIIKSKKIPLIICTSKTSAEIQQIRERLKNTDPFISENGGGIFIPEGYFHFFYDYRRKSSGFLIIELGTPYQELVKALHRIKDATGVGIKGFSMMTPDEVSCLCGFSHQEALLAMRREYDEPFIITDNATDFQREEKLLQESVTREGLFLTKGGRFYHLTGPNDKGRAVQIVLDLFRQKFGEIFSIALGDSMNDAPMLHKVDIAVLIQKENGSFENISGFDYYKSKSPGPVGWNRAVIDILKKYEFIN